MFIARAEKFIIQVEVPWIECHQVQAIPALVSAQSEYGRVCHGMSRLPGAFQGVSLVQVPASGVAAADA